MRQTPPEAAVTEGLLLVLLPEAEASALPLEHTAVTAHLTGPVVEVRVEQTFGNPFDQPIEVTYLFPLPHRAAVTGFEMRLDGRIIRGCVQEREEGRRRYEEARDQGRQASLLEQERPNLFTVSVANVLPGRQIQVLLSYQEHLPFDEGAYRFVFPMVVTPRYIPHLPLSPPSEALGEGGAVPDADRITAPLQPPEERPGGDIELTLTLDAGVPIEEPCCPSHPVRVRRLDGRRVEVQLAGDRLIPNKDFVLTYRPTGRSIRPALWLHRENADTGTFLLSVLPPRDLDPSQVHPKEMIFVFDRSGSMGGTPIVQARNALKSCLRGLNPPDTFHIIIFDDQVDTFTPDPVPFTQEQVDRADAFIDRVQARGGTEILAALQAALRLPPDPERLRTLVFLTDGSVGNEEQVLRALAQGLGKARVFTFGIGPAVNRYLLDKMAQLGRGAAEFLLPDQDLEEAISRFQNRVAFPLLTDLELSWSDGQVQEVYPQPIPDLFQGQPLEVVGRYRGRGTMILGLVGQGCAGPYREEVPVDLAAEAEHPALPRLWARARIEHLLDLERAEPQRQPEIREEIIGLAVRYSLLSPYTSFVALDEAQEGPLTGPPKPVRVSLPLPEGLDYDLLTGREAPFRLAMAAPAAGISAAMPQQMGRRLFHLRSPSEAQGFAEFAALDFAGPAEAALGPAVPEASEVEERVPHREALDDPAGAALRWLARTQNVDGSWGRGYIRLAATAGAVIAFARQGHTPRGGHFRPQLTRAVQWLTRQATPDPADRALVAWALAEVARATGHSEDAAAAEAARAGLPANLPGWAGAAADLAAGRPVHSPTRLPLSLASEEHLQALVVAALTGEPSARGRVLQHQVATGNEAGQIRIGGVEPVLATAWGAVILSVT